MIEESDIIDEVIKRSLNQRQYAPYFHFKGDREGTELDVVSDWMRARYSNPSSAFAEIRHCPPPHDPPDVIVTATDGKLYGFEVTELVDTETVRRAERSETGEIKEYSKDELLSLIRHRVEMKSTKTFKTNCDRSILVIYSDEPDLCYGSGYTLLFNLFTPVNETFSEVWFMIPPAVNISGGEPHNPNCQVFPVKQVEA